MGLITWVIAIIALILGASALYFQVSSPKVIDFQQCTIVSTTSGNTPAQTSCKDLCNNKRCVIGLTKFSENIIINGTPPEFNSQESLISCSEIAPYGEIRDTFKIENHGVSCVCCS